MSNLSIGRYPTIQIRKAKMWPPHVSIVSKANIQALGQRPTTYATEMLHRRFYTIETR